MIKLPDLASMGFVACDWRDATPMASDGGEAGDPPRMALVLWSDGRWKIDDYTEGMRGIHERTHGLHPTYLYSVTPIKPKGAERGR